MRRAPRQTAELEAELLRLNELLRERRQQLARLEQCPHKDCECRQVWREVIERKLAHQVGKVRRKVRRGRSRQTKSSKRRSPKR